MTNAEKYNFDFFTINNYRNISKLALDEGFIPCFYDESLLKNGRRELLWRHDVEFSPTTALQMAEIEHSLGLKATYFFQLHSEFYNVLEKYNSDIVVRIASLGHQIGIHFDSHYYCIQTPNQLEKYIIQDKNYFETVFGLKLFVFSFHNTTPFILSCNEYQYGGLINVYSSYFIDNFKYCSDSTGYWRWEQLDEVLKDKTIQRMQVLTHDAMWSKNVLPPRQRVFASIDAEAQRVKDNYDRILPTLGAMNINWE